MARLRTSGSSKAVPTEENLRYLAASADELEEIHHKLADGHVPWTESKQARTANTAPIGHRVPAPSRRSEDGLEDLRAQFGANKRVHGSDLR